MRLAIRADGDASIGFGHLVRTGALAGTVLDDGGDVVYLTRTPDGVESVCPEGVDIVELPEEDETGAVTGWLRQEDHDAVLTDTYEADTDYQRAVRAAAEASMVVLDDTRYTVCADYLVNGNVYAPGLSYEWTGPEPTWCLGTEYLLVREAIRRVAADPPPFRERPGRAVVTMGGSDIRDTTPEVCRAFDGVGVTVDVIVGPGFENGDRIRRAVEDTDAVFEVRETPEDFPERIARADLAVSAAGSTTYELLAVGTPTIAIPQADNQWPVAETLSERDAVEPLDPDEMDALPARIEMLLDDAGRRRSMRETGRRLVDCRGTERLYRLLEAEAEA